MKFSNSDDKFAMFSVKFKNINTGKSDSKLKVQQVCSLKRIKKTAKQVKLRKPSLTKLIVNAIRSKKTRHRVKKHV